jgi:hypothetical protein
MSNGKQVKAFVYDISKYPNPHVYHIVFAVDEDTAEFFLKNENFGEFELHSTFDIDSGNISYLGEGSLS